MKEIADETYQQLDEASKLENTKKELEEKYNKLENYENELNKSLYELNANLSSVQNQFLSEESKKEDLTELKARLENAKHEKLIAKIISIIPNLLIIVMSLGMCRGLPILMIFRALGFGAVVGSLVSIYLYYNLTSEIRKLVKKNNIEDIELKIEEEEKKQYEKAKELYNNLSMKKDKILDDRTNTFEEKEEIIMMLDELDAKKKEILNQLLITFQNNQSTNDNPNQEDSLLDKGPCKKMS
jgi:hypothetical protein